MPLAEGFKSSKRGRSGDQNWGFEGECLIIACASVELSRDIPCGDLAVVYVVIWLWFTLPTTMVSVPIVARHVRLTRREQFIC